MSEFPEPEEVTTPKLHWSLIKVLYKGPPDDYSLAIGKWDQKPVLAVRWNACEWRPLGNPQSRGLPTWFVLPERLVDPILQTLDAETRAFARKFLPEEIA